MNEALNRPGAESRTRPRAQALYSAAQLHYFRGELGRSEERFQEALEISRALGDAAGRAQTMVFLGAIEGLGGGMKLGRMLEEGISLARETDNRFQLAIGLNHLAEIRRGEGDLERAEPLYQEALALSRSQGDWTNVTLYLLNLARVQIARAGLVEGGDSLREVMRVKDELGASRWIWQHLLDAASGLAAASEDYGRAARLNGVAEELLRAAAASREPLDEGFIRPLIARARASLGEAAFETSFGAGRLLRPEDAVREVREWLEQGPAPGGSA